MGTLLPQVHAKMSSQETQVCIGTGTEDTNQSSPLAVDSMSIYAMEYLTPQLIKAFRLNQKDLGTNELGTAHPQIKISENQLLGILNEMPNFQVQFERYVHTT